MHNITIIVLVSLIFAFLEYVVALHKIKKIIIKTNNSKVFKQHYTKKITKNDVRIYSLASALTMFRNSFVICCIIIAVFNL